MMPFEVPGRNVNACQGVESHASGMRSLRSTAGCHRIDILAPESRFVEAERAGRIAALSLS